MKRRLITSIFLALAVAVTSTVVLTGCASKSYYYKQETNGAWTVMGEIPDTNEGFEDSNASSAESSSDESKADESSEEESKADESSEEESKADESSEEESKEDTASDGDTLATLKFEKPEDWEAPLSAKVYDVNNNKLDITGTEDGDVFIFVVPKKADGAEKDFSDAKVKFQGTVDGKTVETEETAIDGDKTYTAGDRTGKVTYAIVEK